MRQDVACAWTAQAGPARRSRRGGANRCNRRRHQCDAQLAASHAETSTQADCAALTKGLQAGGEARSLVLAAVRGSVLQKAFEPQGCRLVQDALWMADRQTALALVEELHGSVRSAIQSPYANFVIQKVIEVMPTSHFRFILEELRGDAPATARHRYGCRILCRLLEYAPSEDGLMVLIDEILAEAGVLCFHFFGHHVLQHILEHGSEEQRHRVTMAICANMRRCAQDPHGSFLVEAAMRHCSFDDHRALARCLLGDDPERFLTLTSSRFGSHVVRAFLRLPCDASQQAYSLLREHAAQLASTKFGRHVLEDMHIDVAGLTPAVTTMAVPEVGLSNTGLNFDEHPHGILA